ncbi:MAG: helix-turn-helix domain-containing protein [Promethearchaeota archaeon]
MAQKVVHSRVIKELEAPKYASQNLKTSSKLTPPKINKNTDRTIYETLAQIGPTNRTILCQKTGIPRTTLFESLKRLLNTGFIREFTVRSERPSRGRPPVYYEIIDPNFDSNNPNYSQEEIIRNLLIYTPEIDVFCAKLADRGPEPFSQTCMDPFGSSADITQFVTQQSLFYQVALGQGDSPAEGLFGPFPVKGHLHKLAYVYSFEIFDSTVSDPRLVSQTHAIVAIIFPEKLESYFPSRKKMQTGIASIVQSISDLSQVPKNFATQIRNKITLLLHSNSALSILGTQ